MGKAWRTPSLVALALLVALLAAAMAEEEGSAAPTVADAEDTTAGGAPAPAPAPASEEPSPGHKTIGAKAKEGWHSMVAGLSAGKAKLECKVLGNCPDSDSDSHA